MVKITSQDNYANLRSKLEERRSQLRAALHDEKAPLVRPESNSQDIELSYLNDLDQAVDQGIDEQHILELREIEAALQRMDAGHYGVCQDCGASIDIKRLSVYPVARRCLGCKQALEQAPGNTRTD